MAVYSIICEYNPFHNGHKYQIDSLKPDTVVCLMSSDFVQRGSMAVCDKYTRARAALECGADLVLELPYPFSMLSAEYFASAGVKILDKLGFTDYLSFGCECDDLDKLEKIAEYLVSDEFEKDIKEIIKSSPQLSFAVSRERAIEKKMGGEYSTILREPNNILGVEYIKAIKRTQSSIAPKPLLRKSAGHHDVSVKDGVASAGTIRRMIKDKKDFSHVVPETAYEIYNDLYNKGRFPSDFSKLDTAFLAFLRKVSSKELSEFYDCYAVSDIIKKAASQAVSMNELYDLCSGSNFTRARIRRCIMAAFMGLKQIDAMADPLYTTVLGLNHKGAKLLSGIRKECGIAIITKPAHIKKYDGTDVYRQYMMGLAASDIYGLTFPEITPSGDYLRKTPVTFGF